ncbi:Protein PsiE [Saezia sanguinis]|jgi:protein PsiE|uniref:Protein PsiE n=1 Tax=Saezia sanguinis TaxID=1965230 RepID=A0A433SFE7_9BURK|nr:phosphate-starvation-inducible protein PsiE [Saezia sanguinis]RUS67471.1 Protein PsiE [Saezia sanguinis]
MKGLKESITARHMAKVMKWILACMLLTLAVILLVFLVRESWVLIGILLDGASDHKSYAMIEAIIIWFLYFEFIALIGKYFESGFHFPLRYFIYIGITAIVRLIIVDHEKPMATLIYSVAILVLLGALYIANTGLLKRI